MNEATVQKAAIQFGTTINNIEVLGNGLIHKTFKVTYNNMPPIVLQCVNRNTFIYPENMIQNYSLLQSHLKDKGVKIAAMLLTLKEKPFWIDEEENFWRAYEYIPNSYCISTPQNSQQVFKAAQAFATFTQGLSGLPLSVLNITIPQFHNLQLRHQQFRNAVKEASHTRLHKAGKFITDIESRSYFIDFYEGLNDEARFPTRLMHHDCKLSNVLFDKETDHAICVVDLDTVMPGKFFSDLGDMIRTMACTEDENSTNWDQLDINEDFYKSIVDGYYGEIQHLLTEAEKENIHYTGLIMTYMQALRFLTDYLNNDIYYFTSYKEQNFDRATNQLLLLQKLENFLSNKYAFEPVKE